MNTNRWKIAACLFLLFLSALPASAITGGEPDGGGHPAVGAVLAFVPGAARPRVCTGVLVHPRVLLTAGHCLYFWSELGITPDEIEVRFATDFNDPGAVSRPVAAGFIHPDFDVTRIRQQQREDIAVVILAEPATDITPARRAGLGFLDDLDAQGLLQGGPERTRLTRVGYGITLEFPPPVYAAIDGIRRVAYSEFQALVPAHVIANNNQAAGNSGVCGGDSGGPAFWTDPVTGEETVVSLTSWGDQCIGHDVSTRIDTANAVAFIDQFIACVENEACG